MLFQHFALLEVFEFLLLKDVIPRFVRVGVLLCVLVFSVQMIKNIAVPAVDMILSVLVQIVVQCDAPLGNGFGRAPRAIWPQVS